MMTQTHLLAGAAAFAKPGDGLRNGAVVVGSILPDAAIFALFAWSKLADVPEREVWDVLYFADEFQAWVAAGNAVFLWLALLIAGFLLLRVPSVFRVGLFVFFVAAAALLHVGLDLPVHHDDAHRHFWPISDWRFRSPVSYWDPAHHGRTFMWIEAVFGILLAVVLFRRFRTLWVRVLLALLVIAYVAVPAYFTWQLGGAA